MKSPFGESVDKFEVLNSLSDKLTNSKQIEEGHSKIGQRVICLDANENLSIDSVLVKDLGHFGFLTGETEVYEMSQLT